MPVESYSMTKSREEQISLGDAPFYHCYVRCVRQAYLCGEDTVNSKTTTTENSDLKAPRTRRYQSQRERIALEFGLQSIVDAVRSFYHWFYRRHIKTKKMGSRRWGQRSRRLGQALHLTWLFSILCLSPKEWSDG